MAALGTSAELALDDSRALSRSSTVDCGEFKPAAHNGAADAESLGAGKSSPIWRRLRVSYLFKIAHARALAKAERLATGTSPADARPQRQEGGISEPQDAPGASSQTREPEFAVLDTLLNEAGVLETRGDVALLSDPRASSIYLEQAIAALAADVPEIASPRMRELAYLANVLMSGAESQGKRYTQTSAARAVMATANLGAA